MTTPDTRRVVYFKEFGDPSVLELTTEPMPQPGPDELLVAIEAVGVNFADTMVRRGEYRRDQKLPDTPGMEACGRIISSRAASIPAGNRVALFLEQGGGYTDHVVVPAEQAFVVDERHAPEAVAGVFLQGVTGWYAIHRYGQVTPGKTVLVTGAAGGVGGVSVQLAKDAGAQVIGLASSDEKRSHARKLGCDHVFAPDADFATAIKKVAPRGVDVILDGVGGDLFPKLLRTLAQNGRFVVVGSATQRPANLDVRHLLPRGQTISGFVVRNVMNMDPGEPMEALDQILQRIDSGVLTPTIEVLPMSHAAEAHEKLEKRTSTGKLVLDPHR